MRQLFTQNLGWKLLSVLLAVGLWLAIAREPEVATSLSVPVEFRNMRDDLDISGNLPDRIRIEVRGPSGRLTRDNLSAVAAVMDLSDAEALAILGEYLLGKNGEIPDTITFEREAIGWAYGRMQYRHAWVVCGPCEDSMERLMKKRETA